MPWWPAADHGIDMRPSPIKLLDEELPAPTMAPTVGQTSTTCRRRGPGWDDAASPSCAPRVGLKSAGGRGGGSNVGAMSSIAGRHACITGSPAGSAWRPPSRWRPKVRVRGGRRGDRSRSGLPSPSSGVVGPTPPCSSWTLPTAVAVGANVRRDRRRPGSGRHPCVQRRRRPPRLLRGVPDEEWGDDRDRLLRARDTPGRPRHGRAGVGIDRRAPPMLASWGSRRTSAVAAANLCGASSSRSARPSWRPMASTLGAATRPTRHTPAGLGGPVQAGRDRGRSRPRSRPSSPSRSPIACRRDGHRARAVAFHRRPRQPLAVGAGLAPGAHVGNARMHRAQSPTGSGLRPAVSEIAEGRRREYSSTLGRPHLGVADAATLPVTRPSRTKIVYRLRPSC